MDADKEKLELEAGHFVKSPPSAPLKTILLVDDGRATRLMTKWFLDYTG